MITVSLTDKEAVLVANVVESVRKKVADHLVTGMGLYEPTLLADPELAAGIAAAMQTWLRNAARVITKIEQAPHRAEDSPTGMVPAELQQRGTTEDDIN